MNPKRYGNVNGEAMRRLEAAANGHDPNVKPVGACKIGHDPRSKLVVLDLGDGPRSMHPAMALNLIEGLTKGIRAVTQPSVPPGRS